MALNPLFLSGPLDPDGTPQVSPESTGLLLDDFSGNLARWTTGGTTPSTANGIATTSATTTASATSYMRSVGAFTLRAGSYLGYTYTVRFEAAVVPNNTRWWGAALNQTTPTAAAPVLHGIVFLLDYTAGALQAATYNGGTRTVVAILTRPTDGGWHRYEVVYRQSVAYWLIDGVVVATRGFPDLAVATALPTVIGSANHTTAPSTGPVLNVQGASVRDQSGTNRTVSDGAEPWIQATVRVSASPAPTAADNLLLTQAVAPPSLLVTATAAAGSAAVVTLPAPASGLRHYVTSVAFEHFDAAMLTASAAPVVSSATNHAFVTTLPADAGAQGTVVKDVRAFQSPVASLAAATATTFTAPATANVVWRVTVTYYVAA